MKYKLSEDKKYLIPQPEMKEPQRWWFEEDITPELDASTLVFDTTAFNEAMVKYKEHLKSLPQPILISGDIPESWIGRLVDDSEFKVGKVYLARGSKYKLEGDNNLHDALQDEYGKYYYPVAIPLPVEEEPKVEPIKEESQAAGEYILCAAIWYRDFPLALYQPSNVNIGVVMCGKNHAAIIHQHVALMNKKQSEMGRYEQGFITNTNKFVNRKEAALIAIIANQVNVTKVGKELYSEDLNKLSQSFTIKRNG